MINRTIVAVMATALSISSSPPTVASPLSTPIRKQDRGIRADSACHTNRQDAILGESAALDEARRSLSFIPKMIKERYHLDLRGAADFTGACARHVRAKSLDIIGLENGSVYQLTKDGLANWPRTYAEMFSQVDVERQRRPEIPGATFVHAVPVNPLGTPIDREVRTRMLGLWRQGTGSLIVDFVLPASGRKADKVRPLLRSNLPVRSISYFPSPDTASGSVSLVQEVTPERVRVLTLEWWHKE